MGRDLKAGEGCPTEGLGFIVPSTRVRDQSLWLSLRQLGATPSGAAVLQSKLHLQTRLNIERYADNI